MSDIFESLIERNCDTEQGVFGRLFVAAKSWLTVERPDLGNLPNVSCIPTGTYVLKRSIYYKPTVPYECWEIQDVPDRTLIKIHKGNIDLNVEGCVAVGMKRGMLAGRWAVMSSGVAYDEFMWATRGYDSGVLTIRWGDHEGKQHV